FNKVLKPQNSYLFNISFESLEQFPFFSYKAGNALDSILSAISSSSSQCGFALSVLWGQVNFFMVAGQEKIETQAQLCMGRLGQPPLLQPTVAAYLQNGCHDT
ncbi:hypothetical protein M5D96_005084, partial [Drosophila gunungcola]